jgi:hypothetical protein
VDGYKEYKSLEEGKLTKDPLLVSGGSTKIEIVSPDFDDYEEVIHSPGRTPAGMKIPEFSGYSQQIEELAALLGISDPVVYDFDC